VVTVTVTVTRTFTVGYVYVYTRLRVDFTHISVTDFTFTLFGLRWLRMLRSFTRLVVGFYVYVYFDCTFTFTVTVRSTFPFTFTARLRLRLRLQHHTHTFTRWLRYVYLLVVGLRYVYVTGLVVTLRCYRCGRVYTVGCGYGWLLRSRVVVGWFGFYVYGYGSRFWLHVGYGWLLVGWLLPFTFVGCHTLPVTRLYTVVTYGYHVWLRFTHTLVTLHVYYHYGLRVYTHVTFTFVTFTLPVTVTFGYVWLDFTFTGSPVAVTTYVTVYGLRCLRLRLHTFGCGYAFTVVNVTFTDCLRLRWTTLRLFGYVGWFTLRYVPTRWFPRGCYVYVATTPLVTHAYVGCWCGCDSSYGLDLVTLHLHTVWLRYVTFVTVVTLLVWLRLRVTFVYGYHVYFTLRSRLRSRLPVTTLFYVYVWLFTICWIYTLIYGSRLRLRCGWFTLPLLPPVCYVVDRWFTFVTPLRCCYGCVPRLRLYIYGCYTFGYTRSRCDFTHVWLRLFTFTFTRLVTFTVTFAFTLLRLFTTRYLRLLHAFRFTGYGYGCYVYVTITDCPLLLVYVDCCYVRCYAHYVYTFPTHVCCCYVYVARSRSRFIGYVTFTLIYTFTLVLRLLLRLVTLLLRLRLLRSVVPLDYVYVVVVGCCCCSSFGFTPFVVWLWLLPFTFTRLDLPALRLHLFTHTPHTRSLLRLLICYGRLHVYVAFGIPVVTVLRLRCGWLHILHHRFTVGSGWFTLHLRLVVWLRYTFVTYTLPYITFTLRLVVYGYPRYTPLRLLRYGCYGYVTVYVTFVGWTLRTVRLRVWLFTFTFTLPTLRLPHVRLVTHRLRLRSHVCCCGPHGCYTHFTGFCWLPLLFHCYVVPILPPRLIPVTTFTFTVTFVGYVYVWLPTVVYGYIWFYGCGYVVVGWFTPFVRCLPVTCVVTVCLVVTLRLHLYVCLRLRLHLFGYVAFVVVGWLRLFTLRLRLRCTGVTFTFTRTFTFVTFTVTLRYVYGCLRLLHGWWLPVTFTVTLYWFPHGWFVTGLRLVVGRSHTRYHVYVYGYGYVPVYVDLIYTTFPLVTVARLRFHVRWCWITLVTFDLRCSRLRYDVRLPVWFTIAGCCCWTHLRCYICPRWLRSTIYVYVTRLRYGYVYGYVTFPFIWFGGWLRLRLLFDLLRLVWLRYVYVYVWFTRLHGYRAFIYTRLRYTRFVTFTTTRSGLRLRCRLIWFCYVHTFTRWLLHGYGYPFTLHTARTLPHIYIHGRYTHVTVTLLRLRLRLRYGWLVTLPVYTLRLLIYVTFTFGFVVRSPLLFTLVVTFTVVVVCLHFTLFTFTIYVYVTDLPLFLHTLRLLLRYVADTFTRWLRLDFRCCERCCSFTICCYVVVLRCWVLIWTLRWLVGLLHLLLLLLLLRWFPLPRCCYWRWFYVVPLFVCYTIVVDLLLLLRWLWIPIYVTLRWFVVVTFTYPHVWLLRSPLLPVTFPVDYVLVDYVYGYLVRLIRLRLRLRLRSRCLITLGVYTRFTDDLRLRLSLPRLLHAFYVYFTFPTRLHTRSFVTPRWTRWFYGCYVYVPTYVWLHTHARTFVTPFATFGFTVTFTHGWLRLRLHALLRLHVTIYVYGLFTTFVTFYLRYGFPRLILICYVTFPVTHTFTVGYVTHGYGLHHTRLRLRYVDLRLLFTGWFTFVTFGYALRLIWFPTRVVYVTHAVTFTVCLRTTLLTFTGFCYVTLRLRLRWFYVGLIWLLPRLGYTRSRLICYVCSRWLFVVGYVDYRLLRCCCYSRYVWLRLRCWFVVPVTFTHTFTFTFTVTDTFYTLRFAHFYVLRLHFTFTFTRYTRLRCYVGRLHVTFGCYVYVAHLHVPGFPRCLRLLLLVDVGRYVWVDLPVCFPLNLLVTLIPVTVVITLRYVVRLRTTLRILLRLRLRVVYVPRLRYTICWFYIWLVTLIYVCLRLRLRCCWLRLLRLLFVAFDLICCYVYDSHVCYVYVTFVVVPVCYVYVVDSLFVGALRCWFTFTVVDCPWFWLRSYVTHVWTTFPAVDLRLVTLLRLRSLRCYVVWFTDTRSRWFGLRLPVTLDTFVTLLPRSRWLICWVPFVVDSRCVYRLRLLPVVCLPLVAVARYDFTLRSRLLIWFVTVGYLRLDLRYTVTVHTFTFRCYVGWLRLYTFYVHFDLVIYDFGRSRYGWFDWFTRLRWFAVGYGLRYVVPRYGWLLDLLHLRSHVCLRILHVYVDLRYVYVYYVAGYVYILHGWFPLILLFVYTLHILRTFTFTFDLRCWICYGWLDVWLRLFGCWLPFTHFVVRWILRYTLDTFTVVPILRTVGYTHVCTLHARLRLDTRLRTVYTFVYRLLVDLRWFTFTRLRWLRCYGCLRLIYVVGYGWLFTFTVHTRCCCAGCVPRYGCSRFGLPRYTLWWIAVTLRLHGCCSFPRLLTRSPLRFTFGSGLRLRLRLVVTVTLVYYVRSLPVYVWLPLRSRLTWLRLRLIYHYVCCCVYTFTRLPFVGYGLLDVTVYGYVPVVVPFTLRFTFYVPFAVAVTLRLIYHRFPVVYVYGYVYRFTVVVHRFTLLVYDFADHYVCPFVTVYGYVTFGWLRLRLFVLRLLRWSGAVRVVTITRLRLRLPLYMICYLLLVTFTFAFTFTHVWLRLRLVRCPTFTFPVTLRLVTRYRFVVGGWI